MHKHGLQLLPIAECIKMLRNFYIDAIASLRLFTITGRGNGVIGNSSHGKPLRMHWGRTGKLEKLVNCLCHPFGFPKDYLAKRTVGIVPAFIFHNQELG